MNLDQLMKAGAAANELSAAIAEALPLIHERVNPVALTEEDDGGSI
ncbi:MAG: hypothetical protein LBF54_03685 [Holosporaceae bacterium]|jgi:hypothetical protein|nr:hypothetical protein [Holosporaceae bacterium]